MTSINFYDNSAVSLFYSNVGTPFVDNSALCPNKILTYFLFYNDSVMDSQILVGTMDTKSSKGPRKQIHMDNFFLED